jgi:hypothetical protein
MNTETHSTYEEFCTAAHTELAAIARAHVGRAAKAVGGYWDAIADASSTGILLSLCKCIRLPDYPEWPGVPQLDYEPMPELERRIGHDILNRPGPFAYETNVAIAEALQRAGQSVNFPISSQGRAAIHARVVEYIKLAKWRFSANSNCSQREASHNEN